MSRCLGVTSGQCGHSSLSFPPVELVIKRQRCKQLCAAWFQGLGAGQRRPSCQQGSRLGPGGGSLSLGHLSQPQVAQARSTGASELCLWAQGMTVVLRGASAQPGREPSVQDGPRRGLRPLSTCPGALLTHTHWSRMFGAGQNVGGAPDSTQGGPTHQKLQCLLEPLRNMQPQGFWTFG